MARRILVLFAMAAMAASLVTFIVPAGADDTTGASEARAFLVLYADGASLSDGQAAVAAAGGTVHSVNEAIGLAEVSSTNPAFLQDVRAQRAVKGAARDRSVGTARPNMGHKFADERREEERPAGHQRSARSAP